MAENTVYDCIIIGAGPGGLQAAIYLGRFNRSALVIDRGSGRTTHARRIENYLTQKVISGQDIIRIGMEQAESFGAVIVSGEVTSVVKDKGIFRVATAADAYAGRYVIVSTGGR